LLKIDINKTKNTPSVNYNNMDRVYIIEDEITYERCPVYCVQVPSEIFYVRRNGKGVWTGNSRSTGPRTLLLHQPSEGRARGGGMRIGEMERDALIAHGIAKYIKEKLMDTSDIYTTYVCDMCGLFAQRVIKPKNPVYSTDKDVYYCPACNNKTNISKIVIPYAFKLLVQELMSMCVAPRIHTENDKYTS
jgi:DNA-directed RNA polymerase II subunit RPB2